MKKRYIHYGDTAFDESKFQAISNSPFLPKPSGGFWASPVDAPYGWATWCKRAEFGDCRPENSFTFTLREDARVLILRHKCDLDDLPKVETPFKISSMVLLDFESIQKKGWDAVEVDMSGGMFELHHPLYGWGCDSIVVFNPSVIIPDAERDF